MSYRTYNTRNTNSGRFNNSGQFVSSGEQAPYTPPPAPPARGPGIADGGAGAAAYNGTPRPTYAPTPLRVADLQTDVDMRQDEAEEATPARPHWMKSKLDGVKKVSKKERRRRQNNNLRRLITPKNALMVLNEMVPGDNVASNFKVEQEPTGNKSTNFCADLVLEGVTYKGFGENKLSARNAAAEQAIRDLILKKMNDSLAEDGSEPGAEPLPMLQLASFALHKLFAEWEHAGHKLPARRPPQSSECSSAALPAPPAGKPARALPVNAASLHPCMLLTYMRPAAAYRELSAGGAQLPSYTMAVDVDGDTWVGTASNKKEARRLAAKAVCEALFGVQFDPAPSSNVPLPAQ